VDALCRAIGAGIPVTLASRTYLLAPLTLGDLGVIEHHLLAQRLNPIESVLAATEQLAAHPDLQRELIERAALDLRRDKTANKISPQRLMTWLDSMDGEVFTGWLGLRKEYPQRFDVLERVQKLFARATKTERREFRRRRDMATGVDMNSLADWPTKEVSKAEEDARRPRFIPWRRMVRKLMIDYGLSLTAIAGLTQYQVKMLSVADEDLGGIVRMSAAEHRQWRKFQEQQEA
jgi:hypothetical protein